MTGAERGFLLLTSHLGDPLRPVLTVPQFRELTNRVHVAVRDESEKQISTGDLTALGYSLEFANRIIHLLSQEDLMDNYIRNGTISDCTVVTRANPAYPAMLRKKMGLNCPGSLWLKGDVTLLSQKAIAVVGSRDLRGDNRLFAEIAGRQIAAQGYVLISGNARGTDRTAQDACLEAGGRVIIVVADSLKKQKLRENILYISEDGFDSPFNSFRALSRNRVIHALGGAAIVAQSSLGKGGTWQGTTENLRNSWSPVFCYEDGSVAAKELIARGATPISKEQLSDLSANTKNMLNFFDR